MILAHILEPLEDILMAILDWLGPHGAIGLTWAWSIVALTAIVRLLMVPLAVKQIHSMQSMQAHMPEMKAIQQRYKNDKQKRNEELMKFYRDNNVNPAAPCLPLLVQFPVFIALYLILRDPDDLMDPGDQRSWLSIVPDITDHANAHWSGYVLLVIYVCSQLASTYFMSTTMDPRQRYIFLALPFVFVFFIVNFPVGLMLYWTTTNLWTVGQGLVTRRLVPRAPPPQKKSSRTPPKQAAPEPAKADGGQQAKAASGPQRVRRRKKKGPRARR